MLREIPTKSIGTCMNVIMTGNLSSRFSRGTHVPGVASERIGVSLWELKFSSFKSVRIFFMGNL